jgi:hypothetical protein
MLYDEHEALGYKHAINEMERYRWTSPHLQRAYDKGYERGRLEVHMRQVFRGTQKITFQRR